MKLFFTKISLLLFIGFANAQTDCNSWVNLQNRLDAVTVGDLDVTGDKITVEALFNMTGPSVDIVSKHRGGNDANYLLRPVRAEIATVNSGWVFTGAGAAPCDDVVELNKTYHAALVYDGTTLKFYRNGALISQVPATGNLLTNDWSTAIGNHAIAVTPFINGVPNPDYQNIDAGQGFNDESFKGFINEVRIWNVARTQDQIKTYMNTALPNPTTQVGLLGYWVFNNLLNLQGNTLYNGTIEGLAAIGQTNTSCAFVADSCSVVLPVRLTDFNAVLFGKNEVKLTWHTEEESGIMNYIVQRSESSDFRSFANIGKVMVNSESNTNDYSFSDYNLVSNKLYFYRLQINEIRGATYYSSIKYSKISDQQSSVDFYPNPTPEGLVNIKFNNIAGNTTISVFNSSGQVLVNKNINVSSGSVVLIDLKKYEKGNYFIMLVTANNKIVKKVVR